MSTESIPAVTLTEEALQAAASLQKDTSEFSGKGLRIYIDGKGCDGFYYGVAFDNKEPDDLELSQSGLKIFIDSESLKYIKGSVVTWVDDERGRGFLVENPNHRKFRGKFFRRENWQTRVADS